MEKESLESRARGSCGTLDAPAHPSCIFVVLSATTGWEGKTHESIPYGRGSTANSEISLLALLEILNFILRGRTIKKNGFLQSLEMELLILKNEVTAPNKKKQIIIV
jgi:hypothetical protein